MREFEEMEEMEIVRRSNSPWSSPLHIVPVVGDLVEIIVAWMM